MTLKRANFQQLRAFFERLALEWDAQQPLERDTILNRLLTSFDSRFPEAGMVLDVGTGTGALIPIMQKRYPDCRIVSIDLATAMLQRARQRSPLSNLVQADVHILPFDISIFSTVICHNSFPHFWRKQAALQELRRVIRTGGSLLILHDLSREEVNAIHQGAQAEIIHQDVLPEGSELVGWLKRSSFLPDRVDDAPEHYIVTATAV
jgi:demethylmenaquinone methyltransferase/2-methoxy-6-polyprenyl-1,4-benzoquinol methylase